jgi:hypothetical protein
LLSKRIDAVTNDLARIHEEVINVCDEELDLIEATVNEAKRLFSDLEKHLAA